MPFDPVIASVTLTGSALSSLATACVLACFVIYRKNQHTFRHSLVLNLTIADFINATNNMVSGIIYIRDHELYDSPACEFNGWLGQISVQATDFSILAIGVATLLIVTSKARLAAFSTQETVLICLSVWVIPLITSTTATAMGEMEPVSGNWCWISRDRTDLRYGLAHGWRFAIVGITIGIYSYVWWFLARHFKTLASIEDSSRSRSSRSRSSRKSSWIPAFKGRNRRYVDVDDTETGGDVEDRHELRRPSQGINTSQGANVSEEDPAAYSHRSSSAAMTEAVTQDNQPNAADDHARKSSRRNLRDVRRMLILNGYPMLYVLLWIPGIVNRIMEASGSTADRALSILQASTQFVGFANAVTYGLNGTWRPGK